MAKLECKCSPYYTCTLCRKSTTYTYEEIAELLGVSHQRVKQIETRALQKMYNAFKLLNINNIEDLL